MPGPSAKMIESPLFKGKEPLSSEDFQRLTLTGHSGAFRTLLSDSNLNLDRDIFLGTLVTVESSGAVSGAQLVKCGTIPGVSINLREVWDGVELEGKLVISDHDASLYMDVNGLLSSSWTDQVPWKVKIKKDGKWSSVKKGALKDHGLSELCFRGTSQPVSPSSSKFLVGLVPKSLVELRSVEESNSRFYPMVKVTEVRAKFYPLAEQHHKFGLAVQPLVFLSDPPVDSEDYVDFSAVQWPASQSVKDAQAALLQASVMPNVHLNVGKWREAVTKKDFPRRDSAFSWPGPRREDEESETDSSSEDSSGWSR